MFGAKSILPWLRASLRPCQIRGIKQLGERMRRLASKPDKIERVAVWPWSLGVERAPSQEGAVSHSLELISQALPYTVRVVDDAVVNTEPDKGLLVLTHVFETQSLVCFELCYLLGR